MPTMNFTRLGARILLTAAGLLGHAWAEGPSVGATAMGGGLDGDVVVRSLSPGGTGVLDLGSGEAGATGAGLSSMLARPPRP